jgi:hypothetical protein
MASQTEGNRLNDVLKWEAGVEKYHAREDVTVLSGQNVSAGAVLGKITKALGTVTAGAGNTGNGTVSGVSLGTLAATGNYVLKCIAAATNGGTFQVKAPDGKVLPPATVGTGYTSDHINFTVNDGSTDFVIGDSFSIPVAAGSGKVRALNLTGVDGSQDAFGIAVADYDATGGDLEGVTVVRDAVINAENLVWPEGATSDQKAAARAQLKEKGIVTRPSA